MMITEEQALAAISVAAAKAREDVVQAWMVETFPLVRERLWIECQAIERIEENIREEFRRSLRRDAG